MAERKTRFKRMIIKLPQSPGDYAAIAATAQLAASLGLDLIGMFLQDIGLTKLAAWPGAREYRAATGWKSLSAVELTHDLARAASEAQRIFAEIIQEQQARGSFSLAKGTAAQVVADAGEHDIIVIVDPRNPLEHVTYQFNELVSTAFESSVSVLIVPSSATPRVGRLVAAGTGANDPGIAAAIEIATSTKQALAIIPLEQPNSSLSRVVDHWNQAGAHIEIAEPVLHSVDASSLAMVSRNMGGRLLITSRERIGHADRNLSRLRLQVPVLLV